MKITAVIALVLAASSAAWAQEKFTYKDNKEQDGIRIIKITWKTITYEYLSQPGSSQTEDMSKVASFEIEQTHKTADFIRGEDFLRRGENREAVDAFVRAKTDAKADPVIQDMARWNIIQAWAAQGDTARLGDAVSNLRKESPESYYTPMAYELLADYAKRVGDMSLLAKVVKELDEAGKANGVPDWSKKAELISATVLEGQGKFKEASTVYKKFTSEKGDVGTDANLGLMRCQSASSDWAALKGKCDDILSNTKGKDVRLLMGAYLGRADIALFSDKKNKDALLGYLLVTDVLSARVADPQLAHEIALSHGAIACARMAIEAKDAETKQTYKQRALELVTEAKNRFGQSGLTQQAEAEVKAVK